MIIFILSFFIGAAQATPYGYNYGNCYNFPGGFVGVPLEGCYSMPNPSGGAPISSGDLLLVGTGNILLVGGGKIACYGSC